MKFSFEKIGKSAEKLYEGAANKIEAVIFPHESWYTTAEVKANSFLKTIDPELRVEKGGFTEGKEGFDRLLLHFDHDSNPFLKWDMKINETDEYLNTQFKEAVVQKYFEMSAQVADKYEKWKKDAKEYERAQAHKPHRENQASPEEEKKDDDWTIPPPGANSGPGFFGGGDFSGGGGSSGGAGASGQW